MHLQEAKTSCIKTKRQFRALRITYEAERFLLSLQHGVKEARVKK
jgi:hypothetical protein